MTEAGQRLRAARDRAGWTQAQLADRAGVSRQLVAAVEAGRNLPRVDAAVGLASALGVGVETLFGPDPTEPAMPVVGPPPPAGSPVLVGRIGRRLVCAAAGPGEAWPLADGVARAGGIDLLGDTTPGTVLAGCDPALGLAAELAAARGGPRLVPVAAGTRAALEALTAGRAHAAVVHGPQGRLPAPPAEPVVRRVHLARWRVGLAAPHPAPDWPAVLAGAGPVVQREPGASAQQAFLQALDAAGGRPPDGPLARGHRDAAAQAAHQGLPAVTIEPAALAAGLAFHPLEVHVAEVWMDRRWLAEPGLQALGDLLTWPGFHRRLGLVGGYDLSGCGSELGAHGHGSEA